MLDRLESLTLDVSTEGTETGVMGEIEGTGEVVSITRSRGEERGLLTALSVGGGDGAKFVASLSPTV